MKNRIVKLIAWLSVFVLLISSTINVYSIANPRNTNLPTQLGINEDTLEDNIANYELVAENQKASMYADMKKGWFAVRNNETGHIWYSHPNNALEDNITVGLNKQNFQSELIVNYVYTDESEGTSSYVEGSINSQTGALRNNSVSVEKIENGIKVVYDFYPIATRIPVTYTIVNNCLKSKIIGEEILEREKFYNAVKDIATEDNLTMIQYSYITSVWVLPTFGAGNIGDKGFVFVPDGCGAYMNYEPRSFSTEVVTADVYSKELAIDEYKVEKDTFSSVVKDVKVCMPFFGAVNGTDGFSAIISEGDSIAQIKAFKAGSTNAYTGVSSAVSFRTVTSNNVHGRIVQSVSDVYNTLPNYEINYVLLSKEEASIIGFANSYRNYLTENNMISKKDYSPSVAIKTIGAIDVDSSFLGIPCKKIKPLTTFNQMKSILKDFKKDDIENVAVNYIGWANNGVKNKKMITEANTIDSLGGKKELNSLSKHLKENGGALYLDADLLFFEKSGNGVSKNSDAIQTVFGKPSLIRNFTYSTFTYESTGKRVLTQKKLETVFNKYIKTTTKLEKGTGLSFNTMSQYCYSDFNNKNGFSKVKTLELYTKLLSKVEQNMSAETANSYMWKYVDRIFDAPVSSSRQIIYDGEIPFYHLVTHGYVALTSPYLNQCGNYRASVLRMIETGSEPAFMCMSEDSSVVNSSEYDNFYSSNYELWHEDLIELYNEYYPLLKKISNKSIIDYTQISDKVSSTEYDNGICVYVNYSDIDYVQGEITVPANGFYVEEGTK